MNAFLLTMMLYDGLIKNDLSNKFERFVNKINEMEVYKDSKDIVDMTPKSDYMNILNKFNFDFPGDSEHATKLNIERFIFDNFWPPEFDLIPHKVDLGDFSIPNQQFLNDDMKKIILHLKLIWQGLSKKSKNLDNSSLLQMDHPFMVPGGRFREMYYWDSYWIVRGLLKSNLITPVKNMIHNFIDIINRYGFFPNATREYYMNRTQQPYFIQILSEAYSHESGYFRDTVLGSGLKAAEKEIEWLDKNRRMKYEYNGQSHSFYIFSVKTKMPRPESFKEDKNEIKKSQCSPIEFYSNIASVAESGWDFSTRWLRNKNDRNDIMIRELIPTDLNALMCRNFLTMADFYKITNNKKRADHYIKRAQDLKKGINDVLWNKEQLCWNDFNFITKHHNKEIFSISNLIPMLYDIEPPGDTTILSILRRHKDFLFSHEGGIPVTEKYNDQVNEQWDFPNAWAPHQEMVVSFLIKKNLEPLALHVASSFFLNVYKTFQAYGFFSEKYNVEVPGNPSSGGEYESQIGFGWTNGTITEFIGVFGNNLLERTKDGFAESLEKIDDILTNDIQYLYSNSSEISESYLFDRIVLLGN